MYSAVTGLEGWAVDIPATLTLRLVAPFCSRMMRVSPLAREPLLWVHAPARYWLVSAPGLPRNVADPPEVDRDNALVPSIMLTADALAAE